MTEDRKSYSFIGNDCPPGYRRVGTIDVADPADVRRAEDRGYRIGTIYEGRSYSCAEPCAADIYEELDEALESAKALTARAIEIICLEASEMGFTEDTISEFRAGRFDGDDLLTLQAVERALTPSPETKTDVSLNVGARLLRGYENAMAMLDMANEPMVADLINEARAAFAQRAPAPETDVESEIERVVQSVNEWDDRTSPDDYPEHLLITSEELADILRNFAATLEGSADAR
jgi:hypothetical protein